MMTPCEKLGYKVGDELEVVRECGFLNGDTIRLKKDDGSDYPVFEGVGCKAVDGDDWDYVFIHAVRPSVRNPQWAPEAGAKAKAPTGSVDVLALDERGAMAAILRANGTLDVVPYAYLSPIPAQILATPQWVPEVGEECEVLWNDSRKEYVTSVIIGTEPDNGYPVHRFTSGPKKNHYQCDPLTSTMGTPVYRPLPTKEDRAVDEMADVMRGTDVMLTGAHQECIARALYQHGYRKQPQPAEDIDFNDPANWRAGDLMEVVAADSHDPVLSGEIVKLHEDGGCAPYCILPNGKKYALRDDQLRFHSRP